jgi:hypothetical protein
MIESPMLISLLGALLASATADSGLDCFASLLRDVTVSIAAKGD